MPYHTEFRNNVDAFLGRYAVNVLGGMNSIAHGGGTVQQLLTNVGFVVGDRTTEVSLQAPAVYAYFALQDPAQHRDKLPFSKDLLTVSLGTDDGSGTGVPVYLIPYSGGRAMGVRLPSQGTDGRPEAWAMTASQNGCTVEVSGDRASPYGSHTNVIDTQAIHRRAKVNTRIGKLQQRYIQALGGGLQPLQDDPNQNRTQFGFYPPTGPNQPNNYRGYHQRVSEIVGNLENQTIGVHGQLKGGRVETGLMTHTRFHFTPTQHTVDSVRNPGNPPNALVVGHRVGNQWSFYFQESTSMEFHVREVHKFGPKLRTYNDWIRRNDGNQRTFGVVVILSHGQLWPNVVAQDETFQ